LVDSLLKLGHRDIVETLLPAAFDSQSDLIAEKCKDGLKKAGYESEISRESDRRDLIECTETQKTYANALSETDDRGKDLEQDRYGYIIKFDNQYTNIISTESMMLGNRLNIKAYGAEIAVGLAIEYRELVRLTRALAPLITAIDELMLQIARERDFAQNLLDEIIQVENQVDACEEGIERCQSEIYNCESGIERCERAIYSAESSLRSLSAPSYYRNENGSDEDYQRAMEHYRNQKSNLESEISSNQSQIYDYQDRKRRAKSEMHRLEMELRACMTKHSQLSRQLNISTSRIGGFQSRLDILRNDFYHLQSEYQSCERRMATLQQGLRTSSSEAESIWNRLNAELYAVKSQLNSIQNALNLNRNDIERNRAALDKAKDDLKRIGEEIYTTRNMFDSDATRALVETFEADLDAYESSLELFKHQVNDDNVKFRLDFSMRNLIKHNKFVQEQRAKKVRIEERLGRGPVMT
jgi:chromosome segregation ATPase